MATCSFPTFAKKVKVAAALAALATVANAPAWAHLPKASHAKESVASTAQIPSDAIVVSDSEFNTFSFPAPVTGIYFPAGSPVIGQPIYLDGNTKVLLQLGKGSDGLVQAVFSLKTGQLVTLRLVPRPVQGITYTASGPSASAKGQTITSTGGAAAGPRADDVDLLKALVSFGRPPSSFSSVALPALVRFDKFSAVPLAAWSDGSKTLYEFSLVAAPGQTAVVSPPQFYRSGIGAVAVSGDTVDAQKSPTLFVVEDLGHE